MSNFDAKIGIGDGIFTCTHGGSKYLYIVGEVLDVDGDCGGYNLGFAWMSGIKAGKGCSQDD